MSSFQYHVKPGEDFTFRNDEGKLVMLMHIDDVKDGEVAITFTPDPTPEDLPW